VNEQKNIAAALVKAQRSFGTALKDKTNPAFRSKYADLGACIDAVMGALNVAGIALIQRQHPQDGGVCIETVFLHESGEQISAGLLTVPAAKQDSQGYGSALTYARRYSLMAACGIAPEDDDGNAASKRRDDTPAVDMSPKARAARIMTGVAAGDAEGAALALSQMDAALCDSIWQHINPEYQDKLTAAWPKVES
jgi:ERF superfamily